MLIRALIWGFILYVGYLIIKSFRAIIGTATTAGNQSRREPGSKPAVNKSNAEDINFEEVGKNTKKR